MLLVKGNPVSGKRKKKSVGLEIVFFFFFCLKLIKISGYSFSSSSHLLYKQDIKVYNLPPVSSAGIIAIFF